MTRLQKKCLIAVAGTHLMLVVLLLCSGFFKPSPKPDDTQVLDVIPANIIDAAFRSGVRNAPPPTPTPPTPTPPQPQVQPQQQPAPPPPKQIIQPPPPKPPERTVDPTPVEHTGPKPPPAHKIEVSMDPVVRKNTPQVDKSAEQAKAEAAREAKAARDAKRARDSELKAIRSAASAVRNNTASSTTVELKGDSTAAYADYASVVKTVYTDAWNLPDTAASDDANVKVSVTIASDGTVTESHIVQRSGDSSVDESVQRTLDRVRQLEPFPEGSTDKERTYIINFNLKAKRQQLG
jgi:TonB family protein